MDKSQPPSFAALVQEFFAQHLVQHRSVSPRTVAAYRDAFGLFLAFAERQLHKPPTQLALADLDSSLILGFLDHLERVRHNSVRSRNARLAALRAFLKYAARRDLGALQVIERALSVPLKRFERPMIGFLSREQVLAVMDAPDASTWVGRRDRLLIALLYNSGARVSEIIAVRAADVILDGAACVHLSGKGRKQRSVPLWRSTVKRIRAWLQANEHLRGDRPLLPNRDGEAMTRSNVRQRLQLAVEAAAANRPDLVGRDISPHTIRHTTAMHLLQAGVDVNVIALWLGHESPSTTHMYVEADLAMKERALGRLQEPEMRLRRYRPSDRLVQFLRAL